MAHCCSEPSHTPHPPACRTTPQAVLERMRTLGLRVTTPRIAILEHLAARQSPCSIQEMADALGARCDWATIFRTVRKLEQVGLVRGHEFGDKQRRYELAGLDPEHHHHFLVCRQCNRMETIESCCVEGFVSELERRTGFSKVTHSLEFFGLCPACASKT